MRITCICGKTTMDFKSLGENSFPDGWENDCCRKTVNMDGQEVKEPPRTKTTVEQWLEATRIRNKTRDGFWVPAMNCYSHYAGWMERMQFKDHIVNITRFGREMRKLCSCKRKNSGKVYLLEKSV